MLEAIDARVRIIYNTFAKRRVQVKETNQFIERIGGIKIGEGL